MAFPDDVAVKYDVYTLFCRRVMERLESLESAVEGDENLSLEECLRRFNGWLSQFLNDERLPASEASIRRFCDLIKVQAGGLHNLEGRGTAAAAVFHQVVSDASELAPSWQFLPGIESYHDQGRELARAFFNKLSNSVPSGQLDRKAELDFEYKGGSVEQKSSGSLGLGYRVAPMVTFPRQNKIILRFTNEHDFPAYLLYLFLFLHEYTGHIFANDCGSALISDGWMIFAADNFLRLHWMKSETSADLKPQQVFAFRRYFLTKVSGQPRDGYETAQIIHDLLDNEPGTLSFEAITYQLATFTPEPDEEKSWPAQFFTALRKELMDGDKRVLLSKIKSARDIRGLYSTLTPPKPLPF